MGSVKVCAAPRGHKGTEAEACVQYRGGNLQQLWRLDEDGASRIIASIEDPFVIGKILCHLEARRGSQGPENRRPGARAPPPGVW